MRKLDTDKSNSNKMPHRTTVNQLLNSDKKQRSPPSSRRSSQQSNIPSLLQKSGTRLESETSGSSRESTESACSTSFKSSFSSSSSEDRSHVPPKASQPKPREITVNITTIMGKIIPIQLQTSSTVAQLKELVSQEAGINPDSQMLVFCGKQLLDDSQTLKSLNIQDQSNLNLVLKMAGGPGPPIQMKSLPQELDQVVFLLCKQNQELYVLEVHLREGERPRTVTKHHLRLQSPSYGKKLLDFLGSNEFFDISDLCELQIDLETSQEYESIPDYQEDFETMSAEGENSSRPISAKSSFSYDSSARISSRPDSGSSQLSAVSTASFESLLWQNEHYLTDQLLGEPTVATMSTSVVRPATAISIMRLPSGSRPMVIIPKARPSTAEQWVDGFKSHMKLNDDLFEEQSFTDSSYSTGTPEKTHSPEPAKNTLPIDQFETLHLQSCSSSSLQSPMTRKQSKVPVAKKRTPPIVKTTSQSRKTVPYPDDHMQHQLLHFSSKSRQASKKVVTPRESIMTPIKVTIKKRQSCGLCQKRLGPAQTFTCKCEKQFCAQHRYSDRHTCTYDYKTQAKAALAEANPLIKSEKLLRL